MRRDPNSGSRNVVSGPISLRSLLDEARESPTFDVSQRQATASSRYEPKSLTWALKVVIWMAVAVAATGILALVFTGFGIGEFHLDPIVLASLVGGMSIQSAAAIVSPLAKGIADVVIAQYSSKKSSS
jgi:hypothetical protein